MLAPGDLTTDLFCFGHLNKHTVRHSSGPKDLTCLTNKIVKVCEQKKSPPLIMSLNTHYNHIIRKPSCFTESMPKDPKDAWKVCPGFKSHLHFPCTMLPQQQNLTVLLKELCISCSADQVFSREHISLQIQKLSLSHSFHSSIRKDYN